MTVTYQCSSCKKQLKKKDEDKTPSCCGKPMVRQSLDICLQPDHPEHARPMDAEDACDDFRAGK